LNVLDARDRRDCIFDLARDLRLSCEGGTPGYAIVTTTAGSSTRAGPARPASRS
jgi:hypothetical protein